MPSPADNAAYQAAGLALLSNVIAQFIVSYQTQTPFKLNTTALVQFVVFAYLSTPPNYHWQIALEKWFPGYHMSKKQEEKASSREVQETKKLNVRNTVIKFLLDQVVGGTINTAVFIAAFAAFNKRNIPEACTNQFWDMRVASLKLWPAVSLLSYTVIPAEKRILFANAIGVFWGIYLSLFASGQTSTVKA